MISGSSMLKAKYKGVLSSMDHDITRLGVKKVKKRHSSALEILTQAPKRIRTRQRVLQRTERQAFLQCYCLIPVVLHRYHNEEYSSGCKQLVLGVNNIARPIY